MWGDEKSGMNGQRSRRILVAALVISLVVHAIVATVMRWPFSVQHNDVQVVSLEARPRVIAVVKRVPTPHPAAQTPRPLPVHHVVHTLPTRTRLPSQTATRDASPVAVVSSAPEPTPMPSPPGGACVRSDAAAAVLATPPPADISPEARADAKSGT